MNHDLHCCVYTEHPAWPPFLLGEFDCSSGDDIVGSIREVLKYHTFAVPFRGQIVDYYLSVVGTHAVSAEELSWEPRDTDQQVINVPQYLYSFGDDPIDPLALESLMIQEESNKHIVSIDIIPRSPTARNNTNGLPHWAVP